MYRHRSNAFHESLQSRRMIVNRAGPSSLSQSRQPIISKRNGSRIMTGIQDMGPCTACHRRGRGPHFRLPAQ